MAIEGPWIIDVNNHVYAEKYRTLRPPFVATTGETINDCYTGLVALPYFYGETTQAEVAQLIAAAPDLLRAVEELLLYIEADNELKVIMYPQSIEFARSARAKAKGVQS